MIALDGSFFATGQRCTASSRLIVTDGIHDRSSPLLAEKVAALRVGDALDPDTQMGPAVSEAQMETQLRYIDIARGEGGRIVTGGERLKLDNPGWYVQPTLIADTDADMRINNEEVFGPVASTIRVKDYEEALAVANGVEFGLSAGIVTTSLKHARDFQRRAKAGMTMVNLPTAGVDYHVPVRRHEVGQSSYGAREQGFAAVEFFTQTKTDQAPDEVVHARRRGRDRQGQQCLKGRIEPRSRGVAGAVPGLGRRGPLHGPRILDRRRLAVR
jgi:acyl-CoA reductase-like NAD-dependent aldehyde dehydrogenase